MAAATYRLAMALAAPVWGTFTVREALRSRDARYLRQRLGASLPQRDDRPLWVHCASVGEVLTALPLIVELAPLTPLLLTTTTPGGAGVAARRLAGVPHAYLPLDYGPAVKRFLERARPRAGVILETEIWPTLYGACAKHGVPLVLANARLSPRTSGAPGWLRGALAVALQVPGAILARSEEDARAFAALGADPARVRVLGNLKFAPPPSAARQPPPVHRRYVLAASTHADEERQLAQAWSAGGPPDTLLVIAPRHPTRRDEILKALAPLGLSIAVRSRGDAVGDDTDLYLADTLGEMEGFMRGAEAVFMGGSLVPRGGHNLLEPARIGKPVLFGPHMENFADEARRLLAVDGAIQVADAESVAWELGDLLGDAARATGLGSRAAALVQREADVVQRYAREVITLAGLQAPT